MTNVSDSVAQLIKSAFKPATIDARGPAIVSIAKADAEEQIVFGAVYIPNVVDSQGDYASAETIKKAAYDFVRKGNLAKIDTNHTQNPNGSYVVESFIARKGDPDFIEGSWVVGVHIPDTNVWSMVKSGELNGFSMDGWGIRKDAPMIIEIEGLLKGETEKDGSGHVHTFMVKYDENGQFLGGRTDVVDGHYHEILRGTSTEDAAGHSHRFDYAAGVCYAR